MTVREAQAIAARSINARDAQALVMHVLGRDRAWLLAHPEYEVYDDTMHQLRALIRRRAAGEPLQYLTGTQEFYGLSLRVAPGVLIPRPETEHLVEAVELWAAEQGEDRTLEIADVGTGSGAIAIAIATHVAAVHVTAIDVSTDALAIAVKNARLQGCESKILFIEGDLLVGADDESFDAVLSNPPYVPDSDAETMQTEVVKHEPQLALFGGEDGLDTIRRLVPEALRTLKAGGLFAMEFGFGQRGAIVELLGEGWKDVRFLNDYAGIPRVALATKA